MKKALFLLAILTVTFSFCTGSRYAAGDNYYTSGNYEEAIKAYSALLESDPADVDAMVRLGDAYRSVKEYDPALENYGKALEFQPGDEILTGKLRDTLFEKGESFRADEKYGAAIRVYTELRDRFPGFTDADAALAECYLKTDRLEKARELYSKILETDPENSAAQEAMTAISSVDKEADEVFNRAKSYYNKKMYYEASDILKEVVSKNAENIEAKYMMYMCEGFHHLGRSSESEMWKAIEAFGNAMALYPDKPEPYFHMAQAYEKKADRKFDESVNMYKKVIEIAPEGELAQKSGAKIKELTEKQKRLEKFFKKKKKG